MIDLTVIVVSHETRSLLQACLESIAQARLEVPDLRVETIVVDNGSRDGSLEVVLASPIRPRLVALIRNRGFAAAVNRALRLRRGRHVLLLNSDAEIEPDLLARGVALLDESLDVGIAGAALLHPDGRPQRSVHAFPGLMSELLPDALLPILRPDGFPWGFRSGRSGPEPEIRDVEAVRGAVLFIRGEMLETLGSFDEGYFFFLEETDYCWRAHAAGYRVVHCGALRATHQLGASSKRRAPLETRIEFHRSLYRFLDRRRGPRVAWIARQARVVRNVIGLLGWLPPAIVSARARRRLAERRGLLLWHLRGCGADPGLAHALEIAPRSRIDHRARAVSR